MSWLRLVWRFLRLLNSPVWRLADEAVLTVIKTRELQHASGIDPVLKFCPRCGQIPDGDRRMEEAREILAAVWRGKKRLRRSDQDFAIAWAYFKRKPLF